MKLARIALVVVATFAWAGPRLPAAPAPADPKVALEAAKSERTGGRSVSYTADDYREVFRAWRAMYNLASVE